MSKPKGWTPRFAARTPKQRAALRAARLEQIEKQVESGSLVVRQATPEEIAERLRPRTRRDDRTRERGSS